MINVWIEDDVLNEQSIWKVQLVEAEWGAGKNNTNEKLALIKNVSYFPKEDDEISPETQ